HVCLRPPFNLVRALQPLLAAEHGRGDLLARPLGYVAEPDLARFGPGVFSPGALPRRLERLDEPPNALVLAPLRRRDHGAAARGRRARASRTRLIALVPDQPPHGN